MNLKIIFRFFRQISAVWGEAKTCIKPHTSEWTDSGIQSYCNNGGNFPTLFA